MRQPMHEQADGPAAAGSEAFVGRQDHGDGRVGRGHGAFYKPRGEPAMAWRRALVGVIATLAVIGLGALLWQVLAPGGWTWAKGLMAAGFAGAAPWLGLCAANGLIGAALAGSRPRGAAAAGPLPRCAIVVTVRNED
ncbi:MAG: hypothetical protein J0H99_19300, partial [Rhodospirillales bacterium]|nr:hypothetical protein [Rhodospirillales bacterium]